MKKVLVIAGPTASGKTVLSIQLAKALNGEIISGDSQQVYRELNVGTAKITEEAKQAIPHYGLDLVSYDQAYSVKDFQTMARNAIDKITLENKLPIIVGGTGFYLKATLYDYVFEDEMIQDETFDELNNDELYERLVKLDPKATEKIHPNNRKRVLRALNIALKGETKSEREAKQKHEPLYDVFMLVMDHPKELLDKRIEERLDQQFMSGLKEEIEKYFSTAEERTYQSFQAIGYKEWKAYFEEQAPIEEIKQKIVIATRQYAKRQLTWFRHQFNAYWYKPSLENEKLLMNTIKTWLDKETL